MYYFIRDAFIKVVNLALGFITIQQVLLVLPGGSYNKYNYYLSFLVLLNYADIGLITTYRNYLLRKNQKNVYSAAQTRLILLALLAFLMLALTGKFVLAMALLLVGLRVFINIHSQWIYIAQQTHLIYISNLIQRIVFLSSFIFIQKTTVEHLIFWWTLTYFLSGIILINIRHRIKFDFTIESKEWNNILPIIFLPLLSTVAYLLLESVLFFESKRDSYSLFVRFTTIMLPFVNVYVYSNWSSLKKINWIYQLALSIFALFVIVCLEFLFFRDKVLSLDEYIFGLIFLFLAFNFQLRLWLKFNN